MDIIILQCVLGYATYSYVLNVLFILYAIRVLSNMYCKELYCIVHFILESYVLHVGPTIQTDRSIPAVYKQWRWTLLVCSSHFLSEFDQ